MEQLSSDDFDDAPAPPKQCERCGATKPLDEFPVNRNFSDGHRNRCIPCDEVMRPRIAQAGHPGSINLRKKRVSSARRNERVRTAVFDHYGWSCACCGTPTKRPEIDHVDGNGRTHRIELFGSPSGAGPRFWEWLIKNNFPEGFQTLCGRCNRAKGATDTCPLHASREPKPTRLTA